MFWYFALVIMAALPCAAPWENAAQCRIPLQNGDLLPHISGATPTGKSLDLPADAAGRPAVVVFSFSRTGGKDARQWNETLSRDFPDAPGYTIILLESVPKLFRGVALSGIKSSMPLGMQDHTIVLYSDEQLWKQRLAALDDGRAYLVLLAPDGRIAWINSGKLTDREYLQLKHQMRSLLDLRKS